ncbi:uncharacterized protein LOC114537451 [Dendronephthya gigantea]|uniref:uncharacterized protein LOC114537451 n=1 Tax=Dendronephthya gigantea TaxID=151771 RepID=UPI00106D7007|nr:uncharacterized protein LOC114537451 [Dendronephthya gigantea]
MRKACVKTVVLGRNGKSSITTPLTVDVETTASNKHSTSLHADLHSDESCDLQIDHNAQTPHELPVVDDLENEESATQRRNVSNYLNWEKIRPQLLKAKFEDAILPSGVMCGVCSQNEANIRCKYCGPRQFFCENCAIEQHESRNKFHVMDKWMETKFIPLFPDNSVIEWAHNCGTQIVKLFTLIDAFGNQHLKRVAFCSCESHAVTLLRLHFWPGSPERPTIGFHFRIMDLAEKLFLHNQVPLKDFSEIIMELLPSLQPVHVKSFYRTLNSGSFEEYRYFKYKLKYLDSYIPGLYNGVICPICPTESGTLIECVDACFGLPRRKGKGDISISSRHKTLLFSDQDDVDNFVDNYEHTKEKSQTQDCHRFHAGEVISAIRSKGKNKLFDEKGVFGRVCRHDFPKSLLSIKHGERISYAVYELEKLKAGISAESLNYVLMYDIACVLSNHLQGSGQQSLLSNTTLAIPIFHCYGHKASCQVKYSPRRKAECWLTDGEGVERFWSFLRQFSSITKEMSVDKRSDVLTDATIHYGEHLVAKFGPSLKSKLVRAQSLLITVDQELSNLIANLPDECNEAKIRSWIKEQFEEIAPVMEDLEYQWDESYVDLLLSAKKLRNEMSFSREEEPERIPNIERRISRNEKALYSLEKRHGVRTRWKKKEKAYQNAYTRLIAKKQQKLLHTLHRMASERMFLLELKAKYADGQAIAIKLGSQIDRVVANITRNVSLINGMNENDEISFDDVKDPNGEVYHGIVEPNIETGVPSRVKNRAVDLLCLKDRCEEEQNMVKKEMSTFIHFSPNRLKIIQSFIDREVSSDDELGLHSLAIEKMMFYQRQVNVVNELWSGFKVLPFTTEDSEMVEPISALYKEDLEFYDDVEYM